ncbi:MAG: DUF2341 domain-containing protein, partial [Chitinispirillaceae bacterium]|nr:DUF2341 domain-containing protein [Chitinispirillaceae bacterium]
MGTLVLCMLCAFHLQAQEDYSTWGDSVRISINTSSSGANVANSVSNFPILVRLNPGNFSGFSRTQPGGADIRFATSSGAHLNYQIERWVDGSNNNDTAVIWVRVASISGNNSSQYIRMYYNKSGAPDSSNGGLVFNNGFTSVWHLNDATGAGPRDATATGNHFATRSGVTRTAGVIGFGRRYGAQIGAYDTIASRSSLNIDANRNMTISAWVNRAGNGPTSSPDQGIFCKYRWDTVGHKNMREYALMYWAPNYASTAADTGFKFRLSADGAADTRAPRTTTYVSAVNNTWNHVVATSDGTNMRIYLNGVLQTLTGTATTPSTIFSGSGAATIGIMEDDTVTWGSTTCCRQYFNGSIDEIQFSRSVARNADWIKLTFETQRPSANCVGVLPHVPPAITTQPSPVSVLVGANVSMNVVATGTPTLRYAWYKNSVSQANIVANQTSATLSLTNVQLIDSGNYICVVSNEYGSAQSNPAKLTVASPNNPPTITVHPSPNTVYQTQTANMSVGATGTSPLTFQWYKVVGGQNQEVAGQTTQTLTIANAEFSDSGLYRCVVTNPYGSATSNTARLTVLNGAPVITVQPKDTVVLATRPASFTITATGVGTLRYAWYKGVVDASTRVATTRTLSFTSVVFSDSGSYICEIINDYGWVQSRAAKLTVNDGSPVITQHPRDTMVLENSAWNMSVTASGQPTLRYEWYQQGNSTKRGENRILTVSSAVL